MPISVFENAATNGNVPTKQHQHPAADQHQHDLDHRREERDDPQDDRDKRRLTVPASPTVNPAGAPAA